MSTAPSAGRGRLDVRVVHQFSNPRGPDVLMGESTLVTELGGPAAALTSLAG